MADNHYKCSVCKDIVANKLTEQLDSRFFQIIRGNLSDSYKNVPEVLDPNGGLNSDELFVGPNLETLEYLINSCAMSIASTTHAGMIQPVVMIPSVGGQTVFNFLTERLTHYAKIDKHVKSISIDCTSLTGTSKLETGPNSAISIPNLVKWRMEHEEESAGTKIFVLNNAEAIVSSGSLTLKNVISELSSISQEASFVIFFSPSAYYVSRATSSEEDFLNRFGRMKTFEGFSTSDDKLFKKSIETRLKKLSEVQKIKINDLVFELAITASKGIPYYAFRVIQEAVKSSIIEGLDEVNELKAINAKNLLGLDNIWHKIELLTPRQIDILAALMTFKTREASVYQIQDVLRQFQRFSDRSATLQHIRRLYEYELLDRDRPVGSKQVYYKVRNIALPAIEYRIKQSLEMVKPSG